MTFVFRTISDEDRKKLSQEANEPPRKDFTPRKTHWRHHRKKKPFNHEVFVKKAQLAGLVTSSYLSTQEDEIYVRVGATHERLRNQADNIDFVMPLNEKRLEALARPGNPARHIAPIDIPDKTPEKEGGAAISRFRAFEHMYGKFDTTHHLTPVYERTNGHLFSSMQRLKLVWACLTADKSLGGAAIPVDKRVKQGDVLAALRSVDLRPAGSPQGDVAALQAGATLRLGLGGGGGAHDGAGEGESTSRETGSHWRWRQRRQAVQRGALGHQHRRGVRTELRPPQRFRPEIPLIHPYRRRRPPTIY